MLCTFNQTTWVKKKNLHSVEMQPHPPPPPQKKEEDNNKCTRVLENVKGTG